MKKTFLLLIIATVTASVVFAGGNSDNAKDGQESGPVYIMQLLGNETRDGIIRKLVSQDYPGVEVEFIDVPRDEEATRFRLMVQAKQNLDMVLEGAPSLVECVNNNYITQLDSYVAGWDGLDTLSENAQSFMRLYDGHIWNIPTGSFQRILFYRTDWLKEAGYDHPPVTWEELITMSKRIHSLNPNRWGYSFRGGQGVSSYAEMNMFSFLKPELVDPMSMFVTKEGKSVFDYPEIRQGLEYYKRLYTEVSPPDSINWGFSEMVEAFYSGVTAFLIQDSDCVPICEEYMREGTWLTAPLPKGDNGYSYYKQGWGSMMITAHSPRKNKAFNVIKAVVSPSGNMELSKVFGTYPVQTTAINDPYFGSNYYKPYGETLNDNTRIGYIEDTRLLNTPQEVEYMYAQNFNADIAVQNFIAGKDTVEHLIQTWSNNYTWVKDSAWVKARAASFRNQ
jgi:multiple sugar transport system substrate-binding protein